MADDRVENTGEIRKFAGFDGKRSDPPLFALTGELLEKQKKNWAALVEGYAALQNSLVRELDGENWRVQIQCNPRRIVSSGAKLDPESIKKRPCFLCQENLPAEQEAILYRKDYNILCNPAPIFPGHLTIPGIRHIPQSLTENIKILLLLADDFGPGTTVFYNGPKAGASAPDHLHFQAAPAGLMPVEQEVAQQRGRGLTKMVGKIEVAATEGLARGILVIRGDDADGIVSAVREVLSVLRWMGDFEEEPPLNIFCERCAPGWQLLIFPRWKHRPDAFFVEGERKLVVSPGAADMGGVIIAPREVDFQALTAARVADIYREVAFDDALVAQLISRL